MFEENPVDRARREAREAAQEMVPGSTEIDHLVDGMYELDGIIIDNADCTIASVDIMYDEATNQYTLVNRSRREERMTLEAAEEAERETRRAALLQEIELKTMMVFATCDTVDDAAAIWAAIDSSTTQSARLQVEALGGDVDDVKQRVAGFFLEHPEL
jgi:hypothetical protein